MKRIALLSAVMLIAAPAFAQSVGEKSGVNSALGVAFQEVVHSALTGEAEVVEA
jgi:hypothetical protein